LIDWVDGHLPQTQEERRKCAESSTGLLDVAMESYDVWGGNFVISDTEIDSDGIGKVYYVDQDIPQAIAKIGYDKETRTDRLNVLRRNLEDKKLI
jgi:formylmethanofuran dehydrogenase subunit A